MSVACSRTSMQYGSRMSIACSRTSMQYGSRMSVACSRTSMQYGSMAGRQQDKHAVWQYGRQAAGL